MNRIIYRGYKIEESSLLYSCNVYMPYGIGGGNWYWLWTYRSIEEAKEAIDNHLSGVEMEEWRIDL